MARKGPKKPLAAAAAILMLAAWVPATARADDDDNAAPVTQVTVTSQRLDVARAAIQPGLGASTYTITNDTVESRPGGETMSLDRVLLQMPGVTEDGFGRLHVRGNQGGLEYRINNVIIPEGLTDLGDMLSTRTAASVELVTGMLPAQYGLNVAGVVNITTKSGAYLDGGEAELYGGSHGMIEPAFEYGGSVGRTSFFATGEYMRSNLGLASPDGSSNPLHDRTEQLQGFAYVNHIIDAQDRISLILGSSNNRYQIPNPHGLNALTYTGDNAAFRRPLTADGVSSFPSETLNDNQRQNTQFAILSFLHTTGRATIQLSAYARSTGLTFTPGRLGDLLFHGIGQSAAQRDTGGGMQADALYKLSSAHSLRAGFFVSTDRSTADFRSAVLPVDALGDQTSGTPQILPYHFADRQTRASVYVQDEWTPLKPLTVNFGLRFDHADAARNSNALSPRINAVWTTASGTTIHAGYARYFVPAPDAMRAGMAGLLAGTTGALPTTQGNPTRAETDNYYDVGVQQTLAHLTLGVDGYWRDAKNLIDTGQFGTAMIATPFNFAQGRIRGVEFSLTYAKGALSAWTNLSIAPAEGRGITSNQFTFTPAQLAYASSRFVRLDQDQTYTVSAGVSYRWHALRVSSDLLYGSGFRRTPAGAAPNSGSLPGHVQVNLSGVYYLFRQSRYMLALRCDVINLFGAGYQILDGTNLGAGPSQWGQGRSVFVGVEQSF